MLMPYDDPLLKEFIGYLRMKSRYLLVGLSDEDKRKIEELTEKKEERKVVRKRLSEKSCQKTSNKIVALLKKNAKITQNEIAKTLGISRQAVQKHLANLKLADRLQRIGPDKGGHWEVC